MILQIIRMTNVSIHTYLLCILVPSHGSWDQLFRLESSLLPMLFPDRCFFILLLKQTNKHKNNNCIFETNPLTKTQCRFSLLFITLLCHIHWLIFSLHLIVLGTFQVTLVSRWRIPESFDHLVLCPHNQLPSSTSPQTPILSHNILLG